MQTEDLNENTRQKNDWPVYLFISFFLITFFVLFEVAGPEKALKITEPIDISFATEEALSADKSPEIAQKTFVETDEKGRPFSSHITMPSSVRGIYITGWTAGSEKGINRTMNLFEDSRLNSVVIDIKDATGRLSYEPLDEDLLATGVGTKRIADLSKVIDDFHQRGIYVIGRLTVFQDPFFAQLHPEYTFLDRRTALTWKDYKGIAWLRPDSWEVADYVVAIAKDAYAQGFDEINLDYVRFPSDGSLKNLDLDSLEESKAMTMQKFFQYVDSNLRSLGIPVSADLFGLTMSAKDDLGIGQKVELIAPEVDAVAPMVYPSHFSEGSYGLTMPAKEPYKVIHQSLSDGIARLEKIGISKDKIRPWFQDFDLLGVSYDASMVKAQIEAADDLGIDSWLLWDPTNIYTKEAFVRE